MSDEQPACELSVVDGLGALTRIVTARLPAAAVEAEAARLVKPRAGKPSPSRRERETATERALGRLVIDAINEYAKQNELRVVPMPNLAPLSQQEPEDEDGHYVMTYAIEVQPQIVLPNLTECAIKVPEPVLDEAFYRKAIDALPQRFPTWVEVDRPARLGDRLTIAPSTPAIRRKAGEEHQTLDPETDPAVLELLVGKSAGDRIEPRTAAGIAMTIVCVKEPVIPAYDLDFAKRLDEGCSSIEEFESAFRRRHQEHMRQLVNIVVNDRARKLLDEMVAQFPLPESEIAESLLAWRLEVRKKMPQVSLVDEVGDLGLVAARTAIADTLRRSKILEAFVVDQGLKVEKEEIEEQVDLMAADFEQPGLVKQRILNDQEQLSKIAASIMLYKASRRISELARKVPEQVSVEKLELLASGKDAPQLDDDEPLAAVA